MADERAKSSTRFLEPDPNSSSDSSSPSSSSDENRSVITTAPQLPQVLREPGLAEPVHPGDHRLQSSTCTRSARCGRHEDPFGTKKEMQGATRHFPCHVFWSKMLEPNKYSIWGRRTVGEGEQESVIAMLEAQRAEREEYVRLKEERRWKLATEQKMREFKMAKSEQLAAARSEVRRASEARAQPAPAPNRSQTRRIASIVNRIARRNDSEDLTEEQTASLVNKGLKRLDRRAGGGQRGALKCARVLPVAPGAQRGERRRSRRRAPCAARIPSTGCARARLNGQRDRSRLCSARGPSGAQTRAQVRTENRAQFAVCSFEFGRLGTLRISILTK